ncbi:ABC transporter ATP-binding protein [[Eubacterium] hominis]|uniref:ABC transporter ATP-binding protein n=1 Tax=[Eubacterium] hominis TaxID=2764325 RepID=UPI003A4DE7C8
MTKLLKYLKPFILPLLVVVALLFGQAQCELALPDLMSDIVDTGIQKGGILDGVPSVIRENQYQKMKIFMDEKEQKLFESNYTLLKSETASKEDIKEYPELSNENIYQLNDIDDKTREELNSFLVVPMTLVSGLDEAVKDPDNEMMKDMPEQVKQMLAAGVDIYTILPMMPTEELQKIKDEVHTELSAMGDTTYRAAGANMVKAEYQAIGMDVDGMKNDYILYAGAKMLLVALCSAVAAILVGLFASRIGAGFARDLRKDVFAKVESFSSSEFNKFSTSSLITRTTNDVQQIQMVIIMFLRMVAYAPIIGIGAIIHVMNTEASMTWIIALCVVLLLSLIGVLMSVAMPKFKINQKLIDAINSVTREFLEGMPVIRAFNTQVHEEKKFDDVNQKVLKTNLFINRAMSFMMPAMMFIMNGASLLIVWVGGHQIASGNIQIGDMLAFIQYSMQIIMAFLMIAMIAVMLPRASVSAKRIYDVLSCDNMIKDPKNAKHFDSSQKGYIDFEHVSFRYPGAEEDVLHDISFTAKPGETTAFIGSTGSGKSTIINLVPRFFDVTDGRILVDGVDIRDVTQHELRDKIGYVPQKGVLFSGDIESNLRYAKQDATKEDLQMASDVAQATEFIDSKPEGFATPIAQGGTNVSGGQKQRLSIARALVKKPEIYIFDDSFSALDFKTDANLRAALSEVTKETKATVLLVAQRISSIMHAERIVVLDKGSVAGIGTHDELMKTCEVYQEIAYSQLSKEELGNE